MAPAFAKGKKYINIREDPQN